MDRIAKSHVRWRDSRFYIYVERNYGFEAEHHQRALDHLENVSFRIDHNAQRVGVYTTNPVKHAACELLNVMLREQRVHVADPLCSRDSQSMRARLREQLEIYSYQYKTADNVFQNERVALSGKVGGMKDDIAICLQLGIYFSNHDLTNNDGKVPTGT